MSNRNKMLIRMTLCTMAVLCICVCVQTVALSDDDDSNDNGPPTGACCLPADTRCPDDDDSSDESSEFSDCDDDSSSSDDDSDEGMVLICHIPPDDSENAQSIEIPLEELQAHLDHGDTIGFCPPRCAILDQGTCEARGGTYQGDNLPCDPDPCNLQACCFSDGSCLQISELSCETLGGAGFPGQNCDDTPSPCPPVGACCLPDDTCQQLTEAACGEQEGQFFADKDCCIQDSVSCPFLVDNFYDLQGIVRIARL